MDTEKRLIWRYNSVVEGARLSMRRAWFLLAIHREMKIIHADVQSEGGFRMGLISITTEFGMQCGTLTRQRPWAWRNMAMEKGRLCAIWER